MKGILVNGDLLEQDATGILTEPDINDGSVLVKDELNVAEL